MKTKGSVSLGFMIFAVLISEGLSQQIRQDVGTRLLVPSSAFTQSGSSSFRSILVVFNQDNQPNNIRITARRDTGSVIGSPMSITLPVGARFRSTNILADLGGTLGAFGPITVESTNNRLLSAVSEVSSVVGSGLGPGGFFPGVNVQSAWMQGFILEILDTGNFGDSGTFRTNVGLNTVSSTPATVQLAYFDDDGNQLGSTATLTVVGNGLTQRRLRDVISQVSSQPGYLKMTSTTPIHAWASKIENGTGDPSFQIGIQAASSTPMSQIEPATVLVQNNLLFVTLGLAAPIIALSLLGKKRRDPGYVAA